MSSTEESEIVESDVDTARNLNPLQFFQPGESPIGLHNEGDFAPHAQRVDSRSTVIFEGTDMDDVRMEELSTSDIDPRDPSHDHSEYDNKDEDSTTATEKNLKVPFSTP